MIEIKTEQHRVFLGETEWGSFLITCLDNGWPPARQRHGAIYTDYCAGRVDGADSAGMVDAFQRFTATRPMPWDRVLKTDTFAVRLSELCGVLTSGVKTGVDVYGCAEWEKRHLDGVEAVLIQGPAGEVDLTPDQFIGLLSECRSKGWRPAGAGHESLPINSIRRGPIYSINGAIFPYGDCVHLREILLSRLGSLATMPPDHLPPEVLVHRRVLDVLGDLRQAASVFVHHLTSQ